ncbi:hypothetical protein IC229_07700 [Spirosoma sp. BT702]|uniref:DUF1801 domain-containing protein n=1 Tax=Spirosoma profusum TaxID=2771354 RepID=A0A927AQH7_9BACT|nr:hypothetical protein [Spirosoma profusum]MBD2700513.1 hypothetical protein [Spirosoma profusum]
MTLQQLHDELRRQLLDIDGMTSQPYVSTTGNTPKGGIEEFKLIGKPFAGLRLTDKFLMLYLMPLHESPNLDAQYGHRLKSVRSGKSCLKITKPEKLDREAVDAILDKGARQWF